MNILDWENRCYKDQEIIYKIIRFFLSLPLGGCRTAK
jgi:hypothetical protein